MAARSGLSLVFGLLALLACSHADPECYSVLLSEDESSFEVSSVSCNRTNFENQEIALASWDDSYNTTGWCAVIILLCETDDMKVALGDSN